MVTVGRDPSGVGEATGKTGAGGAAWAVGNSVAAGGGTAVAKGVAVGRGVAGVSIVAVGSSVTGESSATTGNSVAVGSGLAVGMEVTVGNGAGRLMGSARPLVVQAVAISNRNPASAMNGKRILSGCQCYIVRARQANPAPARTR